MTKNNINKETKEVMKLYGDRFKTPVDEYLTGEELRSETNRIMDNYFDSKEATENESRKNKKEDNKN